MAVIDAKKTYKSLKKKGFYDAANRSPDHLYLEFVHKGKIVLYTRISHGDKDLNDWLIKQMSTQCHLDKEQFKDLVNCPLTKEKYETILIENGLIQGDQ